MLRSFALLGEPAGAPYRSAAAVGVPALLLCGAPGSGRTSIAKEAVRRVAEDGRIFARTHLSSHYLTLPFVFCIDRISTIEWH